MNRIILLGNGFDLAHGMKTSYNDFIKDFWSSTIQNVQKYSDHSHYEDDFIEIDNVPSKWGAGFEYDMFISNLKFAGTSIKFKNRFLEHISQKHHIEKWVAIEDEYYNLLKKSYKTKGNNYDIINLNIDFEKIKSLLRDYLTRVEMDTINNQEAISKTISYKHRFGPQVYSDIKWRDFSSKELNHEAKVQYEQYRNYVEGLTRGGAVKVEPVMENLFLQVRENASVEDIRKLLLSEGAKHFFHLKPKNTLFLNFNYTNTDALYNKPSEFKSNFSDQLTSTMFIQIHGNIKPNLKNPIIFGFGDELDDDYRDIEKLNNNEYLENIKSIKYSETDNYKKLLEFVNSDYYQIFVMGHSCGVSDRTLLNTLFENDNCSSIKVYYHQRDESSDNFSDIIRNISRNFNDKAKMRDRVVNKTFCESLGNPS